VSELYYDQRSVGQSVLVSSRHLGLMTKFLLLSDTCGLSTTPILFFITSLHGPYRKRLFCVGIRFRGNGFTEPLLRNGSLFIRPPQSHCIATAVVSFSSRSLSSNGSIRHIVYVNSFARNEVHFLTLYLVHSSALYPLPNEPKDPRALSGSLPSGKWQLGPGVSLTVASLHTP
jgi:hypothetical protein